MSYDVNLVNSTNTNNWLDIILAVNTASSQNGVPIFGTVLLFMIWLFFFMAFKREDSVRDLALSSFLTSIIGILMLLIGIIPWNVSLIPIFIFFISFLIIIFI